MKALLFDMDGVLVDVSLSYRGAVIGTVEHFLGEAVTPGLVQRYKNRGGLNNDWDLTGAILWDRGCKTPMEEIIRVFQRLYIGKKFDGLIRREQWLPDREMLSRLNNRYKTAIVTGRPRREALYALDSFGTRGYFREVIAMEDVPEGRGKPDPFGLLLALKGLEATSGWYTGDTVDDMTAAIGAGLTPLGVLAGSMEPAGQAGLLEESGAAVVLENVNRLEEVLNQLDDKEYGQ